LKWQNWIDNPIQNMILALDCQSQSNPANLIAIWIEKSSNPIQQFRAHHTLKNKQKTRFS